MCSHRRDDPGLQPDLEKGYSLSAAAAEALVSYLGRQRVSTGADIPHRRHMLIEHTSDPATAGEFEKIFIHTLWGNRINYPLSLVLAALFERDFFPVEVMSDNELVMLQLPNDGLYENRIPGHQGVVAGDIIRAIDPAEIDRLVRGQLERGGYFGARFRENAGRALLLPRSGAGRRTPLWVNRLKAKRLMEAVSGYRDFPILVETWRTCIQDEFELDELKRLLQEVADGEITISEIATDAPSPFAEGSTWQSTNHHLYGDDSPRAGNHLPSVDESILKEAVFADSLRPEIDSELVREFTKKVQRIEGGYAPRPGDELIEWVGERIAIPMQEWKELVDACSRDHGLSHEEILDGVSNRCMIATLPGADIPVVMSVSSVAVLHDALGVEVGALDLAPLSTGPGLDELASMVLALIARRKADGNVDSEPDDYMHPEMLIGQWLSYYGPVPRGMPARVFGFQLSDLDDLLGVLVDTKSIVVGRLVGGAANDEICDAENLERILAFTRRRNRGSFEALPTDMLPLFLATWQGVGQSGDSQEDIKKVLAPLFGYEARAGLWEEDILPTRLLKYQSYWLDELLRTTDLQWTGCGAGRISFSFPEDRELFSPEIPEDTRVDEQISRLFPDPVGRYSFWDLRDRSGMKSSEFANALWKLVWSGRVGCDSYEALRRGVLRGFKDAAAELPSRPRRRSAGLSQWKASRPIAGNWYLTRGGSEGDLLDHAETDKDRIRVLLQRYGVLFRELLVHEPKPMAWGYLFRTMRLMELSGEIVGGHFFEGIPGIQFASPSAIRVLKDGLGENTIYCLNAADPASLCGVDVPALKEILPERFPSTYLVFYGRRLVIVARKRGTDLEIRVEPDSPDIPVCIEALRRPTRRSFNPRGSVKVRTVNGEAASDGPYGPVLEKCGFVKDYQGYSLWAV